MNCQLSKLFPSQSVKRMERVRERREIRIMNFLHSLVHLNWTECLLWFWMKNHTHTKRFVSDTIHSSKHFEVDLSVNHRWKIVETSEQREYYPFFLIFDFPQSWIIDCWMATITHKILVSFTHIQNPTIFHSLSLMYYILVMKINWNYITPEFFIVVRFSYVYRFGLFV